MTISPSTQQDIDTIFRLYGLATVFQKMQFPQNQWPEFDRELIATEIREQRQFHINIDGRIACVWAITFHDPYIWEEKDADPSVYIHRIATDPAFRGRNLVATIVQWAKDYAAQHHKRFIRMDTCGHNTKLIRHYRQCGFDFLGISKLKDTRYLPAHYHDADICFFEIKL